MDRKRLHRVLNDYIFQSGGNVGMIRFMSWAVYALKAATKQKFAWLMTLEKIIGKDLLTSTFLLISVKLWWWVKIINSYMLSEVLWFNDIMFRETFGRQLLFKEPKFPCILVSWRWYRCIFTISILQEFLQSHFFVYHMNLLKYYILT